MSLHGALMDSSLSNIQAAVGDWRSIMQPYGTARLWMQYQGMNAIRRNFVHSVRIGTWPLYLQSLSDMHPYLAAAGHNNYTKLLALFILQMADILQMASLPFWFYERPLPSQ